jgi:hypothetical protein
MFTVARYASKYKFLGGTRKGGAHLKDSFDPTQKWVEYALDLRDMHALMLNPNIAYEDKFALAQAIEIANRKKDWHYKHKDFNLHNAMFWLKDLIKSGRRPDEMKDWEKKKKKK